MQSGEVTSTPDYFSSLATPSVSEMELQLEELVQQGILTPEQATAAIQEASAMENISQDPATRSAQMAALQGLQDITTSGGLTDIDQAKLNQIQQQENTAARGQREAIMQNMNQRGMGGSGMDIMAQLQNQQDSATRASSRGTEVAALAQQRALDALMNQGNLATNIGTQQFNQDASKAQAQDAIAQFNAANKQQTNLFNTGAKNSAQAANLAAKQDISNANINNANSAQQYNKELIQQDYQNKLQRAAGATGIASGNAQAENAKSAQDAANKNALIGAAVTAAGTAAGGPAGGMAANAAWKSQTSGKAKGGIIEGEPSDYDSVITPTMPGEFVVRKEDVPEFLKKAHTDEDGEFDAGGFLDSITGHKYNYKGKK